MNKITIVFSSIMLSASSWWGTGTFQPDGSASVKQNTIWRAKGTDVRSTSLRADEPASAQQNNIRHAKRQLSIQSNPAQPGDTDWLYWEAQPWIGVNNQFALDTMRLFVERFPTYRIYIPAALNYTGQIVALMADTGQYIEQQPWIDQYNWLASVYTGDTAAWYEQYILLSMAAAGNYFNLNEDANLYWNIERLFPITANTDSLGISFIRQFQSERGLDTTPFHIIQIPPLPYESSGVAAPVAANTTLSAVPNPANETMTAYVNTTFSAPATLEIYDALGQRVMVLPSPRLQMGTNQFNIDCISLAAGNYYLRFATGTTEQSVQVTIEH